MANKPLLPTDPAERKKYPVGTGVLDYFSAALAEVARVSYQGNEQHNPGQPLHWARGKSTDQADTIIRHYMERGGRDVDGMRHSAKLAWRALALLQEELEAEGAPVSRGSRMPQPEVSMSTTVIAGPIKNLRLAADVAESKPDKFTEGQE